MSKGKYYFSKSLEKGLKILALFTKDSPTLTQSEIAKTLDLNMTTTYRYINTLVEMGYLEKDLKTKVIKPSLHCLLLCINLMHSIDNFKMIKEVVNRINRENNISIDVIFAENDTLMRVYHKEAAETLTYRLPEFSKNSLHNTALGKAYLSSLPNSLITEKVAAMTLVAKTPKTIIDKAKLLEEIAITKRRGFALADEEYLPGVLAIAAPLYDPVTGLGIGAVSFDFSVLQHSGAEIIAAYGQKIQETARILSELLPAEKKTG
ncbi:IclR family transcriptional regulator [Desulfopila sp. IMCC35006]|uniref:IclR family transcriptional regulator n=1 Tax=Desulfopila sp. IMCC35006 TaxID=2569542 RepID=UPI0010AD845D|nr:IclR family transcriptional regulator [Desulfopila sp. IMCC35006]TKB24425.1 IclR family transcriptional regulator [Desulfopila sp. IMCC35006]